MNVITELAGALSSFTYLGTFVLLFLCGVALPVPEEPILLAAGYVCYKSAGEVNIWALIGCALSGIMLGDLAIFTIGRRHGDWLFRSRLFRHLLPDERLARARRLYAEHGSKVVFFGRFIAGIRFVAFFTAGNLGVRTLTFLFYDFLAAMITVPISIYATYHFGSDIERAMAFAQQSHRVVIGAIALAVAVWLVAKYVRGRRARREAQPPGAAGREATPTAAARAAKPGDAVV